MIARLISVQELKDLLAEKKYTIVKYVKVNGEFRFADIYGPEHKDMLSRNEIAQSAGFCTLDLERRIATVKGESMSLKIAVDEGDSERIVTLVF